MDSILYHCYLDTKKKITIRDFMRYAKHYTLYTNSTKRAGWLSYALKFDNDNIAKYSDIL